MTLVWTNTVFVSVLVLACIAGTWNVLDGTGVLRDTPPPPLMEVSSDSSVFYLDTPSPPRAETQSIASDSQGLNWDTTQPLLTEAQSIASDSQGLNWGTTPPPRVHAHMRSMADEFQNGESNATTTIDEARSEPSHSLTKNEKHLEAALTTDATFEAGEASSYGVRQKRGDPSGGAAQHPGPSKRRV